MRSVHGAGFLHALSTWSDIRYPDIIVGSSGDAGNACYFSAGQYELLKEVWCNILPVTKIISPWRPWKLLDVDILIDTVFKKMAPLHLDSLYESAIECLIPITDKSSGATSYVRPSHGVDTYELLRAAKAIPVFYNRSVTLFGRKFIDGEVGPTLADHVHEVHQRGADHVVVINHALPYSRISNDMEWLVATLQPRGLAIKMQRDLGTNGFVCATDSSDTTVTCLFPSHFTMSLIEQRKGVLEENFSRGEQFAESHREEIRSALGRRT